MSRSPVPLRRTVLAAAVALAAVGAAAYPATASPATRHPARTPAARATTAHIGAATGTEGVELQLTPRDRAGLAQLATATGISRTTRLQRLAPLVAGTDRADRVAATLRREGLTVTSSTGLSVDASGPAATVAALFGTAQSPGIASAQPLPRIPSALAGLVTVAYGGNDTRPAERALGIANNPNAGAGPGGTLTVAQARSLYGTAPSRATPSSTGPIIATLQFTTAAVVSQAISNVDTYAHESDNQIYADTSYQPSTNIAAVNVPDSCTEQQGTDHGLDGDEVALDQETLLSVAPSFRQRIYYAKNCGNTQDEALDQIVDDVQAGQPIVALSSSWGECEAYAYYGDSAAKQGDLDAVNSLLAAGVTMFAASGDSGSNDCNLSPTRDAVDTPGSIPGVVSVGGTTGINTSALAVTNEVFSNGSRLAGGGGFSCGYFARPGYQAAVARAAGYAHNSGSGLPACPSGTSERMVPDISEDAGDGLYAVVTDDYGSNQLNTYRTPILGTSFAAPLAAGGFATALFNRGITAGIGDIHGFLYAGHGFHDVKSGNNGDYAAGTGYDRASGVGSPVWSQVLVSGSDLTDVSIASSGAVQVRSAYAGDAYQATSGVLTSGLTVSDPADWQFQFAPYEGDGAADLWAIQLSSSAHTLQVYSQASGYRTRLNLATIPSVLTSAETQVRIGPYAGDGRGDLYLIKTADNAGGYVEIYGFSATSGYQNRTVIATTPIPQGNPDWTFLIGDKAGSGDLVGVLDGGTGSGRTEVHILSRVSGYRTYTTHAKTALGEQNGSPAAQFSLRDVTGDGVPDVVLSLVNSSNVVQLHALTAPSFSTFAFQRVTGLTNAASTDSVGLAEIP